MGLEALHRVMKVLKCYKCYKYPLDLFPPLPQTPLPLPPPRREIRLAFSTPWAVLVAALLSRRGIAPWCW